MLAKKLLHPAPANMVFALWRVFGYEFTGADSFDVTTDDPLTYAPFPNNWFNIVIEHVPTLLAPLTWEYTIGGPLGAFSTADVAANRFEPPNDFDNNSCRNFFFLDSAALPPNPDPSLSGSTVTMQAKYLGVDFGPPVYFQYDDTAYTTNWTSWFSRRVKQSDNSTVTPNFQYPANNSDQANAVTWNLPGFLWEWIGDVTWDITQLTGPTLAINVFANGSKVWYFTRLPATDYSGTSYLLQAKLNGTNVGTAITLTCDV